MPSSRRCSDAALALTLACASCAPDPFVEVRGFGGDAGNPGGLRMFLREAAADGPRDLVVFLHGCNQTHDAARTAGLVARADEGALDVLAPEQALVNNGSLCFNWFERGDTARDEGEAASIASMIAHTADARGPEGRVFLLGLSAGAALGASLLAAYPDVFSAGALFAGGPAACAESVVDAAGCMAGAARSPEEWAALARARAPDGDVRTAWPRLLVVHGTADPVVAPASSEALAAQWAALAGADAVRLELVDGLDHAMPVDVAAGCGVEAAFQRDVGRCAAGDALDFFRGQ